MNWREKTVIKILMLVASLLTPEEWSKEVKNLATHLSVHLPDAGAEIKKP